MDKSAFADVGNLQGDQGVPERRVVRTDIADAAFSIIDWRQHRGRQWPQVGWGTHAVSTHRTRLSCGAGISLVARSRSGVAFRHHTQLACKTNGRSAADAHVIDSASSASPACQEGSRPIAVFARSKLAARSSQPGVAFREICQFMLVSSK